MSKHSKLEKHISAYECDRGKICVPVVLNIFRFVVSYSFTSTLCWANLPSKYTVILGLY